MHAEITKVKQNWPVVLEIGGHEHSKNNVCTTKHDIYRKHTWRLVFSYHLTSISCVYLMCVCTWSCACHAYVCMYMRMHMQVHILHVCVCSCVSRCVCMYLWIYMWIYMYVHSCHGVCVNMCVGTFFRKRSVDITANTTWAPRYRFSTTWL